MNPEHKGGILFLALFVSMLLFGFGYAFSQYTVKIAESASAGSYLADGSGRPLYWLDEGILMGDCNASCMSAFFEFSGRIYAAPPLNQSDFAQVPNGDVVQISYDGRLLYYFKNDSLPGEALGDGYFDLWAIARP